MTYSPTQMRQAVPSALKGLTTVFGMGTGVSPLHDHRDKSKYFDILKYGQAERSISTGGLNTLLHLHLRPINLVISKGTSNSGEPELGYLILRWAWHLDAFSAYPFKHSYPAMLLAEQLVHQRFVRVNPLVRNTAPLKYPAPTEDRDQTVSRRFEPSSRTALTGEQPDPWDLLQPQDAMSRHRGANPPRRCGLLEAISLLSPEYLLSDERRPSRSVSPDH